LQAPGRNAEIPLPAFCSPPFCRHYTGNTVTIKRRALHSTKPSLPGCSPIFDFEKNSSNHMPPKWLRQNFVGPVCAPFGTTVPAPSQTLNRQSFTITGRCAKAAAFGTTVTFIWQGRDGYPLTPNRAVTTLPSPCFRRNRMLSNLLCNHAAGRCRLTQGVLTTGGGVGGCQQHHFSGLLPSSGADHQMRFAR